MYVGGSQYGGPGSWLTASAARDKTTLPQPRPLKEGALPTPAARGRSEESKQKVDLLEQCTGHGSGRLLLWSCTVNEQESLVEPTSESVDERKQRREVAFREREIAVKEEELRLRRQEVSRSRWLNPLNVASITRPVA